uniref:Cleavage and polyadenylation specificity factor subunit 4 n=1 Tax=Anas platyrhynchos platyrhynchos TaxID=8840 RepID=A0A493T4D2_ANAPP
MQELVAGMERLRVELEADVEQQGGAQPLPFLGTCSEVGDRAGTERAVVCKHWLRGLCKKGNGCGFLHGYDVTKRPECYFHNKFGPSCKYKHRRRVMCANYLVGFLRQVLGCFLPTRAVPAEAPLTPSLGNAGTKARGKAAVFSLFPPQCRQKGHYAGKCRKNQLEILLGK